METPDPNSTPGSMEVASPDLAPSHSQSGLEFGNCMSFFFRDPDWVKKLVLGSVFSLLSVFIVGVFFLAGYWVRLIRRSARGEPRPLPEWDDLGGIFSDGALAVGAYLGYLVPLIALMLLLSFGVVFLGGGNEMNQAAVAVASVMFALFWSLVALAAMAYLPAALARLAVERRMGAAFEIEENFKFIMRNRGNYVLAILIFLMANFISQFGIFLFCIGILPASFWAACVGAYALGEVCLRDADVAPPTATDR
jgi:hypothetical protein